MAGDICACLHIQPGRLSLSRFSDGEIHVQIEENVRGMDVFVVQPTCTPVDQHLMELLLLLDALRRASAKRITAVLPYYGYSRQDRKDRPRVPISAKVVANLLVAAGADRLLTLDLHAAQIQGFFDVPVDHLYGRPVLVEYLRQQHLPQLTVVSPDAGGVERARALAKRLTAPLAIIDKRRDKPGVSEVMHVIGDVRDRTCVITDDLVDTAGTLVNGVDALIAQGAAQVYAVTTHAVLSGPAVDRIKGSKLKELAVTNSIPLSDEAKASGRIQQLSIAPLLAAGINSIHSESSISMLFG
ncbi:MAG: ribose-phosphate pyrophosphokinase [Bryobacterales bacterium]|nr:ribose-phosphate pyrophosphokinase [Bryobacterales bacterium]